jgi:hypothetical protein
MFAAIYPSAGKGLGNDKSGEVKVWQKSSKNTVK